MTPPRWEFEVGDRFRFRIGDRMDGVEYEIVSRDMAHGMRTYLLVSREAEYPTRRIEPEEVLLAIRTLQRITGSDEHE